MNNEIFANTVHHTCLNLPLKLQGKISFISKRIIELSFPSHNTKIYLSKKLYAQPYTLNLTNLPVQNFKTNGKIFLKNKKILYENLIVNFENAKIYKEPEIFFPENKETIKSSINRTLALIKNSKLSSSRLLNILYIKKKFPDNIIKILDPLEQMDKLKLDAIFPEIAGRGKGATPEYDDFLAGLAFILNKLKKKQSCFLKSIVQKHKFCFPELSFKLITLASNGMLPEPVVQAYKNLCENNINLHTLYNLSLVGHSSGFDMFAGILYYLVFKYI